MKSSIQALARSNVRTLTALSVCIALVQVAVYYVASATIRADASLAIAQPDTLLYCQAARRIAEGFPFSFSAGTAVSTGTTSVLYPFLLAPLYLAGFKGGSLMTAGFVLNALFYLLFVAGWCRVVCRVFEEHPVSRLAGSLLVATFGPCAYCALAQSDTGLWMAVSAWLAYGLVSDDRRVYVPLLVLAPWVRPEGMVVALSLAAAFVISGRRSERRGRSAAAAVAGALVSASLVFVLNWALTGEAQFSSVAQKGYFKNLGFASAVYATAADMLRIAKAYLLGIPRDVPRDLFFIPVVGAAFMWTGFLSRTWRGVSWRETGWHLAMLGGVATVAMSGWQGTNLDRYLVWIMPVLVMYMAYGAEVVSNRLCAGASRAAPGAALVLFSCATAVVFACLFHSSAVSMEAMRSFAARSDGAMPEGASAGTWGGCGVAYEMSGRRVAHLVGIYSPEFMKTDTLAGRYEILKNEPGTRFDYWMCRTVDADSHCAGRPGVVMGEVGLVAPPDFELRRADWSAYDAAASVPSPPPGTSLRAKVDVAYSADEEAAGYEALTRDGYPLFAPFLSTGRLGGAEIVEGARFLLGGDAMTVALEPGRDVHVVMRTALKCKTSVWREPGYRGSEFELKSPLRLRIVVDGADAGFRDVAVGDAGFSDVEMVVPGGMIGQKPSRIEFHGEHIACAYWFYQ